MALKGGDWKGGVWYDEKRTKGQEIHWNDELRSLGIEPKRNNDLNDKEEIEALADNIKQTYYQDYKSAYSDDKEIDGSHFDYII